MSDSELESPVVIDAGSRMTTVGFSGDEFPKAIFPSIVGRCYGIIVGMEDKEIYVGDEAKAKRGVLRIRYPINKGFVKNWD